MKSKRRQGIHTEKSAAYKSREYLYQEYTVKGKSVRSIARRHGVTSWVIDYWIQKYALAQKELAYRDKEHLADDWHSYWLGFIAADGCVSSDPTEPNVTIKLKLSDASHLEKLKNGLGVANPLYIRKDYAQLSLHGRNLRDAMIRNGITPRKTYGLLFPGLPAGLVPSFIRGYFDGDGSMMLRQRTYRGSTWAELVCRFTCGSDPFLSSIERELNDRGVRTVKRYRGTGQTLVLPLSSTKDNLRKFYDLLYGDMQVCLDRKKEIFDSYWEIANA